MKLQHANRHKKMKLALHSSGMLRGIISQKSEGLNYERQKPKNSHAHTHTHTHTHTELIWEVPESICLHYQG